MFSSCCGLWTVDCSRLGTLPTASEAPGRVGAGLVAVLVLLDDYAGRSADPNHGRTILQY